MSRAFTTTPMFVVDTISGVFHSTEWFPDCTSPAVLESQHIVELNIHLTAGLEGTIPPVYGVDATDPERWDDAVLQPATAIIDAVLRVSTPPEPTCLWRCLQKERRSAQLVNRMGTAATVCFFQTWCLFLAMRAVQ